MALPKIIRGRKLLVASVGVAAVTYACSSSSTSSNVALPGGEGGVTNEDAMISSGNLGAPVDSGQFVTDADDDAGDGESSEASTDGGGDADDAGSD